MLMEKRIILAALILGTLAPWCLAQNVPEEPEKPRESIFARSHFDESEVLVIELAHASCVSVRNALNELSLPLQAACAADSTVILQAPPEVLERVRKEVIPRIDVPDAMPTSRTTAYIQLGHHPTGDLMGLLRTAAPGRHTRVAIDEVNRLLVVHGTEEDISAIREVIRHVDRPAHSLTVFFYFIRADVGVDFDPEYSDLPKGLLPVARSLRENGFGVPTLLGSVILTVNEGQPFEQDSILQTTAPEGIGDQLRFLVSGIARLNVEEELVQLKVEALVEGKYVNDEAVGGETEFEVSTTVGAKLDTFVVLGAGPATTAKGNAVAVAVRVTRN